MEEIKGSWTPELIAEAMKHPVPKYKYIVTDDKEEFITRWEGIVESSHRISGDNLRYLEDLGRIKQMKAGVDPLEVLPWMKEW